VVAAAGDGHSGRQLRKRKGGQQRDKTGDPKGDRACRSGPFSRDRWQNKDSRPDHRSTAQRHRLGEAERSVKLTFGHVTTLNGGRVGQGK